ncbi:hypothetical protein [Dactylosporangium sp. CA-233914]|uniref:hypothetical protein n=1 Tax=Dactylosporangium sp. CA-233914 TaxID=3239934 RepID=UPI003D939B0D
MGFPVESAVRITGANQPGFEQILTPDAIAFVAELHRRFGARRDELLELQQRQQERIDAGETFGFLPETAAVREGDWQVAPPAPGLLDRRVEITGPTDRRMTINALNSGARVWLADLEDANFDGSWVAHPDLVPLCRDEFDRVLGAAPHQIGKTRDDVVPDAAALLDLASAGATVTEDGLRNNVSVALQYLASWMNGTGAVAIFNLMEDAATAEIARSQVWQWIRAGVVLDTGQVVTRELVDQVIDEELNKLDGVAAARPLFVELALAEDFADFLTLPAYARMS